MLYPVGGLEHVQQAHHGEWAAVEGGAHKDQGREEEVIERICFADGRGPRGDLQGLQAQGSAIKVIYRSISGRSRLYWSRCSGREKLEEWREGRLYGAVSENSFRVLARRGIIPDYMVPNLEVETPAEAKHIRRLERLIVEKYMKKRWEGVFTQPGVHAEASGTFLRLHFEASEKRVLGEVEEAGALLQTVWVRDILGVIARLEPDLNLVWRVREWPHGILRGRLNLQGLKTLFRARDAVARDQACLQPHHEAEGQEGRQTGKRRSASGRRCGWRVVHSPRPFPKTVMRGDTGMTGNTRKRGGAQQGMQATLDHTPLLTPRRMAAAPPRVSGRLKMFTDFLRCVMPP